MNEIQKNPDGTYMSLEQMVQDMLEMLPDDEAEYLKTVEEEKLIMFHNSVGRSIRNEYGLWDKENPYTDCNDHNGPTHPDQLSNAVIHEIWCRVRAQ